MTPTDVSETITGGAPNMGSRPSDERQLQAPVLPLRELFERFWPYTREFRGRLILGIGLGLLLPVVQAATIWMFKVLVDEANSGG